MNLYTYWGGINHTLITNNFIIFRYLASSKSEVYVVFLIWKEMVITVNPDDIKVA